MLHHLQLKLIVAAMSLLFTSASTTPDAGMVIESEAAAVGADGRTLSGGRFELRGEAGDMGEIALVGGRFALVGDIARDERPLDDEAPATIDDESDDILGNKEVPTQP